MKKSLAIGLAVVLVLGFFVGCAQPLILVLYLGFGWIRYLVRTLPEVSVPAGSAAVGVACLIGVGILTHAMGRWLWNAMKSEAAPGWRARYTLGVVSLVVLLFASGMAAVGAAHQVGWLMTDPGPVWVRASRARVDRVRCASALRQLDQSLRQYAADHEGRLPDTLDVLLAYDPYTDLSCPGDPGLPYVYHGRGLSLPTDGHIVIAAEPLPNHDGKGVHLLMGDSTVDFFEPDEAARRLAGGSLAPTTRPATKPGR